VVAIDPTDLKQAQAGDEAAFRRLVEPHRRSLLSLCYRMSGSLHDADDLLQESLLRAWKGLASFEQRASLRTWLFRVTTHACLDALDKKSARVLPQDLSAPNGALQPPQLEDIWLEPAPAWISEGDAPDASLSSRESVTLAFLTALQRLPARQRAVLLLREVIGYDAKEVAELLETSVPSVNSALQRARETLHVKAHAPVDEPSEETRALLERYMNAWQSADVDALVSLLREDATLAMPPIPTWLEGPSAIAASLRSMVLPQGSAGLFKLVATEANGAPAFAAYARDDAGIYHAHSLHVLDVRGARVAHIMAFVDPSLFAYFALPATA
jgi:RNA polymerase sigma-70 factor, ECF subfamily